MEEKDKSKWEQFRSNGLLWFVNTILHLFGYAIILDYNKETGELLNIYPEKVTCRGFSEQSNLNGYKKVTEYLEGNIDFLKEAF